MCKWRRLSSEMLHRDNGGSKHLWNVGQFLGDCTVQHPRRQSFSNSPPWEQEILPRTFIFFYLRIRPCGLFQFRIIFEIMNHRHMVGLLGRVISSSQGLYLHRTTQHRQTDQVQINNLIIICSKIYNHHLCVSSQRVERLAVLVYSSWSWCYKFREWRTWGHCVGF
jgi:hypothetical protein